MLGQYDIKGIGLIVGEGRGIHVGLVVQFLERLVHLVKRLLTDVRTIVEHAVHSTCRYAGTSGDILDGNILLWHDRAIFRQRYKEFLIIANCWAKL